MLNQKAITRNSIKAARLTTKGTGEYIYLFTCMHAKIKMSTSFSWLSFFLGQSICSLFAFMGLENSNTYFGFRQKPVQENIIFHPKGHYMHVFQVILG